MRRSAGGGLVYSTESGRMCPACRKALAACACAAAAPRPTGDGRIRVGRESKGRGGKVVTLVRGLALDPAALNLLGKQLRAACGSGGTVKDGVLEIQGDHVQRVVELLVARGLPAKPAGG
jgi:translation initiation factor 1